MRNLSVFIRLLYQFNQRIEWQKVNNLIKNDISCRIADATRLYPRPKGRGFTFDLIKLDKLHTILINRFSFWIQYLMYKAEQLAHSLKLLIQNGTWEPHSKLPSLREQVQRSGLSLITVMNAYQELEAQGLIIQRKSRVILWLNRIIFRFHRPIRWSL